MKKIDKAIAIQGDSLHLVNKKNRHNYAPSFRSSEEKLQSILLSN